MMKILLPLYFVPIAIIFIISYFDMNKGESVEEYIKRMDVEYATIILTFLPVVNILISFTLVFLVIFGIFSMIAEFIFNKIKNIRK